MSRRGKAAWIGFFVPVVPGQGSVLYAMGYCFMDAAAGSSMAGLVTMLAMLWLGGPSILLGGVIAAIAFARTKNKDKDPLKCVGCGYSLVGLTGDKCPECGHRVSTTATMLLALVAVAALGGCELYHPKWHPEGPAQVEQWVDESQEPGRPPSRWEWSPNQGWQEK